MLIYGDARMSSSGPLYPVEQSERPMKLHLHPILKSWVDVERESRRNVMPEAKTEAIVQILREWEAEGRGRHRKKTLI
jgi:hypothetical protein